jgi:hypothetical protein
VHDEHVGYQGIEPLLGSHCLVPPPDVDFSLAATMLPPPPVLPPIAPESVTTHLRPLSQHSLRSLSLEASVSTQLEASV